MTKYNKKQLFQQVTKLPFSVQMLTKSPARIVTLP